MGARTWLIAALYSDPAAYGIPALPSWTVSRTARGGLAFASDEDAEPFISAENPVRVRR
jgi:hypothetical protein